MVPMNRDELRKMVTDATVDIYEDLTPQLVHLIKETEHNPNLSEQEKQTEMTLHMLGYTKSCTNEIIIQVLGDILGLDE